MGGGVLAVAGATGAWAVGGVVPDATGAAATSAAGTSSPPVNKSHFEILKIIASIFFILNGLISFLKVKFRRIKNI